jgi:hypothetical protein
MLFEWGIVGTSDESEQMMAEITKLQILPIEDITSSREILTNTTNVYTLTTTSLHFNTTRP